MTEKENAEETLINMWNEIIEEARNELPLSHEKTLVQFANEAGITKWSARHFLEKEIAIGRMKKRKVRNKNYYSPVA